LAEQNRIDGKPISLLLLDDLKLSLKEGIQRFIGRRSDIHKRRSKINARSV